MRGLRTSILASHDPGSGPFRMAQRMTAIAPVISNRHISRCPIFEVLPRICRPPVDFCLGTSPHQAANSRPLENSGHGRSWSHHHDQAHLENEGLAARALRVRFDRGSRDPGAITCYMASERREPSPSCQAQQRPPQYDKRVEPGREANAQIGKGAGRDHDDRHQSRCSY